MLERSVSDGGPFVVTQHGEEPTDFKAESLLVSTATDTWLVSGTDDLKVSRLIPLADGGIDRAERSLPIGGPGIALLVRPEVIAVSTPARLFLLRSDGGTEFTPTAVGFAGADPDTVWFFDPPQLTAMSLAGTCVIYSAVVIPAGSLAFQLGAPGATSLGRSPLRFFPPIVKPGLVPRFDGRTITLEAYDAGPDYQAIQSATRTHAFAVSLDGGSVKIFDRP